MLKSIQSICTPSSQPKQTSESGAGFTLLEGIIAITVIGVGLTAALSLSLANLAASQGNEKRIVAANLAREGIELVRNQRDSNWLKMDLNLLTSNGTPYAWDTFEDISGQPVGAFFVPRFNPADKKYRWVSAGSVSATAAAGGGTCEGQDCITACDVVCRVFYDVTNSMYGVLPNGNISGFRRLITMQPICYNDAANDDYVIALESLCTTGTDRQVGILVTSIVRYDTKNNLEVVVKERLYNWR